jgi:hypothetical protein
VLPVYLAYWDGFENRVIPGYDSTYACVEIEYADVESEMILHLYTSAAVRWTWYHVHLLGLYIRKAVLAKYCPEILRGF